MNNKKVLDNHDRRFERDRRRFSYDYYSPEQRSGKERRSGSDRRRKPRSK